MDKLAKKNLRNNVARNLDGDGSGGFFGSLGGATPVNPTGAPSKVLEYLRDCMSTLSCQCEGSPTSHQAHSPIENPCLRNHEDLQSCSQIVHKEVLYAEAHVACLESLKDKFGLLASATTAPELIKCFLNAL